MITFKSMREVREFLGDQSPETKMLTGFDSAFIGIVEGFHGMICVYDKHKILKRIMRDGLSWDEAEEHFDFNIGGAYVGNDTPLFVVGNLKKPRKRRTKKLWPESPVLPRLQMVD